MPVKILKHIKGSDLPEEWKGKLNPVETFTITIEPENEYTGEVMPPEKEISKELVGGVKDSEEDIKAGRYTICQNEEETEKFFSTIWNG